MNFIDRDVLNNILTRHNIDDIVRFSLGITRQYRKTPWLTPLVKVTDILPTYFRGHRDTFKDSKLFVEFFHSYTNRAANPREKFEQKWSCFSGFDFGKELIVAGGAVIDSCIQIHSRFRGDADIFILSPTQEGCENAEKRFRNHMTTQDLITEMNSPFTLTMITQEYEEKVQIIKRGYRKHEDGGIAQVLSMFDLSSCKFGYGNIGGVGNELFCTLDGAIALYYGINIVDWEVESPSFWARLKKYGDRGFRIVYPALTFPLEIQSIILGGKVELRASSKNELLVHSKLIERDPKDDSDYDPFDFGYQKIHRMRVLNAAVRKDPRGIYLFRERKIFDEDIKGGRESKFTDIRINVDELLKDILKIRYPDDLNVPKFARFSEESRFKFYWGEKFYADALLLKARILGATGKEIHSSEALLGEIPSSIDEILRQYQNLLFERATEIQNYVDEIYKQILENKYLLENPGQQFRGAFNPIVRDFPKEFWTGVCTVPLGGTGGYPSPASSGETWKPYPTTLQRQQKFTLLCMRRFRPDSPFSSRYMQIDVFKELIRDGGYIDRIYLYDVFTTGLLNYDFSLLKNYTSEGNLSGDNHTKMIELMNKAKTIIAANPRGILERKLNDILNRIENYNIKHVENTAKLQHSDITRNVIDMNILTEFVTEQEVNRERDQEELDKVEGTSDSDDSSYEPPEGYGMYR